MVLNYLNQILALDALGCNTFLSVHTNFWRVGCQSVFLSSINNSYMHISLEVFLKAMRCVSKETLFPGVIHITQPSPETLPEWEIPLGNESGEIKQR